MTVQESFEKYSSVKEMASMNIEIIEQKFRAGMEGRIRAARSELPKITTEYKEKVLQNCVIIGVKGKYGKDFAELAKDLKILPLDYLKTVDMIGDSILKRGGKDQYTSKEHFLAMDELNKIKMNYHITQLPVFQGKFDHIGPNTTIKQALFEELTNQYGGQLYSAVTREEIGASALDMGFKGKVLPVILYNYATDLDPSMLPNPIDVVDAKTKPTKKSVKETLLKAREKLNTNN